MLVNPKFFNAHHSPIGAFASFTLGEKGSKGGFGLELGKPADHAIYIGVEDGPDTFRFLPFFDGGSDQDDRMRYEVGNIQTEVPDFEPRLLHFAGHDIERDFVSRQIVGVLDASK